MKHFALLAGVGLAALIAAAPAQASLTITVNGSEFTNGLTSQVIDGVSWSALPTRPRHTFLQKTLGGFTGVGINPGRTPDEIDIGETLVGVPSNWLTISSFTLGVLFNGPEFNDVNEVAQVTIFRADSTSISATLTATGDTTATWSRPGATVDNLSSATAPATPTPPAGGAVWLVTNPFGNINDIVRIEFTALTGACGDDGGSCTNQSDFTMVQLVAAVPEPASLALLGAGLLGLGFAARRRKAA